MIFMFAVLALGCGTAIETSPSEDAEPPARQLPDGGGGMAQGTTPGDSAVASAQWADDLDLDGKLDANVTIGACGAGLCLKVQSSNFGNFEIPLCCGAGLRAGAVVESGAMGRFGGGLQRWYVYLTKYVAPGVESESAGV